MRKLAIVAGVVVVLLAVGAGVLLANLNAFLNRNKPWLAAQAGAALGRDVAFDEIDVSLFGGVGARLTNLRVAEDPAIGTGDFVRADHVRVLVKVLPALFGRYEVRRVVLETPEVTIIRTPTGYNFDSLGTKRAQKPKDAAAEREEARPEASPPAAAAWVASLVGVRDGRVRLVDRRTGPSGELVLHHLDVTASDVSLTSPVHVRIAAGLFTDQKQDVEVEGTVGPVGTPPDVAGVPLDVRVAVERLDVAALRRTLPGLVPPLPSGLVLSGPLGLDAHIVRTRENGAPGALRVETQVDGDAAEVRYGGVFAKPAGTRLALDVAAVPAGPILDLPRLGLRLGDLEASAKGRATTGTAPAIDVLLDTNRARLDRLAALLPALAAHGVAGTVEAHVHAKGAVGGAKVPALEGTVALAGVSARPAGTPYEISGLTTTLELRGTSAVLPPTTFALNGSPLELAATVGAFEPLAVDFTLKAPELRARAVGLAGDDALHNLAASGTVRGPVVVIDEAAFRVFGGSTTGSGRYDGQDPAAPRIAARGAMRAARLETLLASQAPSAAAYVAGLLDTDLDVAGTGTGAALRRTLHGTARVEVKDGILKGVNLVDGVLRGVTGIPGLSALLAPITPKRYPDILGGRDTRFDRLHGTFRIADARMATDDLTIAARDYTIHGNGTVGFDGHVDMSATLVTSERLTKDLVGSVKEARYLTDAAGRVGIPFRLVGTWPKLQPVPDARFITQALQKAVVTTGVDALLGGAAKALGGGKKGNKGKQRPEQELLDKGLKGLGGVFGR